MHPNSLANLQPGTGNLIPGSNEFNRGKEGDKPRRFKVSECLKRELELDPNVETLSETNAEAIAKAVRRKATAGDIQAATYVRDTTEGLLTQRIEIDSTRMVEACAIALSQFLQELGITLDSNQVQRFVVLLTDQLQSR